MALLRRSKLVMRRPLSTWKLPSTVATQGAIPRRDPRRVGQSERPGYHLLFRYEGLRADAPLAPVTAQDQQGKAATSARLDSLDGVSQVAICLRAQGRKALLYEAGFPKPREASSYGRAPAHRFATGGEKDCILRVAGCRSNGIAPLEALEKSCVQCVDHFPDGHVCLPAEDSCAL